MILKERYTFTCHSIVDLITNSSTQLYIEATESTIKAIKELIDNILLFAKSKHTFEDLFTIELNPDDVAEYKDQEEDKYESNYKNISLIVKSRNTDSPAGKAAASVLSNLTGLFNIESQYDG